MIRYSLLRMLIFFGCLAALWLVGLREPTELPWLVVIAAIASMLISMVVLKPFRAEMVQQIQDRQEAKARARAASPDTDEAVEDGRGSSEGKAETGSEAEEPETFR